MEKLKGRIFKFKNKNKPCYYVSKLKECGWYKIKENQQKLCEELDKRIVYDYIVLLGREEALIININDFEKFYDENV